MTVSAAAKREIHKFQQPDPALILITLTHPDWADDLYFVENDTNIISNAVTFVASDVQIVLPSASEIAGRGTLAIDNVDTELGLLVLAVSEPPISVKAELILASAPDTIIQTWPALEFKSIQFNESLLAGELSQEDYERELWPPRVMNVIDFPGSRW